MLDENLPLLDDVLPPTDGLCSIPPEAVDLPLWKEAGVVFEWMRLRLSGAYRGEGVPRGDGAPVLLIPGFLCSDVHLFELRWWLERIGYRPYASGIVLNARCLDTLGQTVLARLEEIQAETGRRVHLVGHSLGGLLARSAAAQRPELVASVTTLGSPLRQIRSHSLVLAATRVLSTVQQALPGSQPGCMTPSCACAMVQAADGFPAEVPFRAVYTRGDGVVDWQSCRSEQEGCDVEVGGTHMGLMFNPDAYRAVAEHLASVAEPLRAAA